MLKRIFINGILISLLEVILYIFFIILLSKLILFYYKPSHKDVSDGFTILFSIFVFAIIICIKNIYIEFIKKYTKTINIIAILLFSFSIQNFKSIPFLTILMIFSGILTLIFRYYIQNLMKSYSVEKS